MDPDKIKVRVTEPADTGRRGLQQAGRRIEIVLGEGIHNVKCELTPTRMGLSYAGSVRGRSSSTNAAASRSRPIWTSQPEAARTQAALIELACSQATQVARSRLAAFIQSLCAS